MADEVADQGKQELGARLAVLREAAGLTQTSLARQVGYSRSTVANAEAGHGAARHFWQMCAEVLGGDPGLLELFDEVRSLHRQFRQETVFAAQRAREAALERSRAGSDDQAASHVRRNEGPRGYRGLSSWALFAPDLEPSMVERSDDLDSLVSLLADARQPAAASRVVAVVGPGGFGKTTLATQACHDDRVTGSFPEVLWVETGEHCTPARVVQLISDLCVHLDGERPPFSDPEQAGFHLARVLADRRVLLVIDNVWSAADLAPFLLGGPNAVRVVTTRNARVCPASALQYRLGPMSAGEVRELLRRSVPSLALEDAVSLAGQCNGWPLLASVVGSTLGQDVAAGARPGQAAADASRTLNTIGPSAFDVWDADQRANAIGHAITASLRSLEEHVTLPGGPGLRDRYLSLSIFPAATPVPLSVLSTWWADAYGWAPNTVRQFCRVLADRSLVDAYLADREVVVLHDVFRAYLRHLVGDDWAGLHRSLVQSYRRLASDGWEEMSVEHSYMWRYLPHHLREARLDGELADVVASPAYVVRKAAHFGHESLAIDRGALAAAGRPDTGPWRSGRILTDGGRLLHGLAAESDIAATLLAFSTRADADLAVIARLRDMTGAQGFGTLWATSETVRERGHTGAVTSVAGHGDMLASGGEDGLVRIWDLGGTQPVRPLRGHTGWVYAVAISPGGRTVASAGDDGTIRLWDSATGESAGVLTGHRGRIRSLAFSADGELVSGAEDGQACLWDTERTSLIRTMRTPGCPIWAVAIGKDDSFVAAAGEDEFVRLYDRNSGDLVAEKAAHRDWIRALSFSGDMLISGSGDGSVRQWQVDGRELIPIRTLETGARVRAVAASPETGLIVAAGEDATLRAFTSDGAVGEQPVPGGVDWVRSIAIRADGSVVAGCEDGSIRIWDGQGLTVLGHGSDTTWSAAFADDQAMLGRGSGVVEVHDLASAESARTLHAGEGRVWSLAAGSDAVAAACGDGTVRMWSGNESSTAVLNEDERRTWSVALSGAGTRLAASSTGGIVRVWDVQSGQKLWEHQVHAGRVRSMAMDAAGGLLLTGGADGIARLWRLPDGEQEAEFAHGPGWVRAVALDAAGGRVAVGCGTGEIYVQSVSDGQNAVELHGHTGRVLMIGFTADPEVLISAAADGTIRAWSLSGHKHLAEVRVDASLQTAAFDISSGIVLAASAAGTTAIKIPATTGAE